MSDNEFFDVIVIGGGPAGLGSAVHLAEKDVPLLLLEKGKICSTEKTWLTFDHIIKKYELHECVRNRFSKVIFSCYLGNSYSFKSKDFISPIDEERALSLKQNYMRILTSLYDLLLALPQAKMPEQIVTFVKGLIKGKDNPIAAKKHSKELPRQQQQP